MTWNQLKLPETSWNHPETTWNQPYCSIFLLKISYSQVRFALILHAIVFLGQIWSHKLKFSKLTEMWYRHTLLCPYFEFNVLFSKFLTFIFFWANLVPKSEVLWINWNLVQECIAKSAFEIQVLRTLAIKYQGKFRIFQFALAMRRQRKLLKT